MTACLFEDWFINIFCPEVEEYCHLQKIPFKILLLLDNAPSHPASLDQLNPYVRVKFMTPNVTASIQPMDQGIITTFKKYYLKYIFKQIFDKLKVDKQLTLHDFWHNYNISDAIENIEKGWRDLKISTMNTAWKNLWPDCINFLRDDSCLLEAVDNSITDIITIGQQLEGEGFYDLNVYDIEEVLQSHDAELTINDLIELNQEDDMGEGE
ncbi:hypothetical protein CDAR_198961 [Caerostris darwini]|nr:hypothetical protein CDAR_198961 [Caerostris darwini]